MQKVVFLILHYKTINDTIDCVNSIFKLEKKNFEVEIIIIDNGSKNGSGEKLLELFNKIREIQVIILNENLGFSRGNNEGYRYVDRNKTKFLIVTNNDVIFSQHEFLKYVNQSYEKNKFGILGPDIIENDILYPKLIRNCNPLNTKLLSYDEVANIILKSRKQLEKYKKGISETTIKDKLRKKLLNSRLYYHFYKNKLLESNDIRKVTNLQKNVCLYGACLLFSYNYIKEYDKLFYPETFLYAEEELLLLKALRNNIEIIYDPAIFVYHKGKSATKNSNASDLELKIFRTEIGIESLLIYQNALIGNFDK